MNRSARIAMAQETVAIVERGTYHVGGLQVDIYQAIQDCLDSTRYYPPEDLAAVRRQSLARSDGQRATRFEVVNETTIAGMARVVAAGAQTGSVAALNFASARNPGGGFLNGALAQEETLASRSALYASLLRGGEFYDRHRNARSPLYSNAMIVSPNCPIFRDDSGSLLVNPHVVTFITSSAPNAGAIGAKHDSDNHQIRSVLRQRADMILAVAASIEAKTLVLGAWGCGVFRNNPSVVAAAFADLLRSGIWAGRFDQVVFSILDHSPTQETIGAFEQAFA